MWSAHNKTDQLLKWIINICWIWWGHYTFNQTLQRNIGANVSYFSYSLSIEFLHRLSKTKPPKNYYLIILLTTLFSRFSVVWLSLHPFHLIKLNSSSPWASKCVFMGYPPNMKWYKALWNFNQKIFVSRDGIFHENKFPLLDPNSTESNDLFHHTSLPNVACQGYYDNNNH